jgi:peptidoglycan/xylan/chitin deacetylase (PgdA/CDA1 family)
VRRAARWPSRDIDLPHLIRRGRTALQLVCVIPALACGTEAQPQLGDAATPAHDAASAIRARYAGALSSTDTSPARLVADAPTDAARIADDGRGQRIPNEMGRIPILQYHLIGDRDGRWERGAEQFRRDLQLLYERGYRPVSVSDLVDRRLELPRGLSPVVFTFDDASPSQFRYVERNGQLEIDPTSAVGIWLDFNRRHADWENKAVFCMLSGAEAGRSFFGNKNIEGQKTEWRFPKVRFLAARGFELCNHTLWHANLGKYDDAFVQEQIARGGLAIDSVIPGYRVRTFALPLGVWPKNVELARRGAWRDPVTARTIAYDFSAVLLVSGQPVPSPHDPAFDPFRLERVQVFASELEKMLDRLDRSGARYISDGDPLTIARPTTVAARLVP